MTACVNVMKKETTQPDKPLVELGGLSARLVNSHQFDELLPDTRGDQSGLYLVISPCTDDRSVLAYCRLLRSDEGLRGAGFECAESFASDTLIAQNPGCCFLEIGSFKFLHEEKQHRANGLLWQAIALYCARTGVDYVVGCLPFKGKYPAMHAMALSYLYHYYRAQPTLLAKAKSGVSMDIMPPEAIKPEVGFAALPPMLRYCLRHGARVGDGVVVDRLREKINLFVIVPTQAMPRS